jgi:hypothetical protein
MALDSGGSACSDEQVFFSFPSSTWERVENFFHQNRVQRAANDIFSRASEPSARPGKTGLSGPGFMIGFL